MDTDQTLTTSALASIGTTDAVAKTNIGTYTPTAAKWQLMVIGLKANFGICSIWNDNAWVATTTIATGPDAAILMNPYALFRTRNTTSKQIDIDFIAVWHERNAT